MLIAARRTGTALDLQRMLNMFFRKKPFELARQDAIVAAIAVMLVMIWMFVR